MCEMIHLRSTCRVFNNRRGHLRTQKASEALAAGDPTGGAYTAPQARIARPAQSPTPALSTLGFQLQPLGRSNWGPPSYCWTRAPQSLATSLNTAQVTTVEFVCQCHLRTLVLRRSASACWSTAPHWTSTVAHALKKVKVAHTWLPSVGFRSWSRFLAVSLQVMWVINPAVGCHYLPPGLQLPPQPFRGLLPILLLGEQRHNGREQFA